MIKLKEDVPSELWLAEQVDYAVSRGRNAFGVPHMGKITAKFDGAIHVSLDVLRSLPGQRNEQDNVREDDLKAIKTILQTTGKLPLGEDLQEYLPYIEVAYNGEAWVNEGNHRIMGADELDWTALPVRIRYFDGGQRVESGPLFPVKLLAQANALEVEYRLKGTLAAQIEQAAKKTPFQEWFNNSAATDHAGRPLVLYHGTQNGGITVFDTEQPQELGTHFGTAAQAQQFARDEGGVMHPVYLSVQRPLRLQDKGEFTEEYVRPQLDALGVPELVNSRLNEIKGGAYLRERITQAGYDSVVYLNRREGAHDPFGPDGMDGDELSELSDAEVLDYYGDEVEDSFIAILPTQVKSAIGNNGDYSQSDDMRFSRSSEVTVTKTPAFKAWFKDSKVVDAEGKPLVVYHGTSADITEFKRTRTGEFGPAIYTTSDPNEAAGYAKGSGSRHLSQAPENIMPVYVSLKNPFTLGVTVFWNRYNKGDGDAAAVQRAIDDGFDGVIEDRIDYLGKKSFTHYIAFLPNQIKSSTGNNGDYSASQDIRFSFAGTGAERHDAAGLLRAQRAVLAGDALEAVRLETGWHQGADKAWRFEIDDSQALLLPAIKSLSKGGYKAAQITSLTYLAQEDGTYMLTLTPGNPIKTTDFVVLSSVSKNVLSAVLPEDVYDQVRRGEGEMDYIADFDEGKKITKSFSFDGFNALPLDEVLDHPALFKAYPMLRTVMVKVNPGLGIGGSLVNMEDGTNVIELGLGQQLSTLIHETQHMIQQIEKFARGGTPKRSDVARSKEYKAYCFAQDNRSLNPSNAEVDYIVAAYDRIPNVMQAYHRLAGEVEARNAQTRQELTAQERKLKSPESTADVAVDDQIVVMDHP
jgi:hypothetical protein